MEITTELKNTLKHIHSGLSNAIKEDSANTDQMNYTDRDVALQFSAHAVSEHSHFTRLNKIKHFKSLMDNWEAFKTVYKDAPIMDKIGMEILENKMSFDSTTLKDIQEYPHRKQVLYYFKKGENVTLPAITPNEYSTFSQTVLNDIGQSAQEKLTFKKALLNMVSNIKSDKSQDNLQYLSNLAQGTKENGKITCPNDDILAEIKKHIMHSDFKFEDRDGKYMVELPMKGTTFDNNVAVACNSVLLQIDKKNPKDYCIEVSTIPKKKPSLFFVSDLRAKNNPTTTPGSTNNTPKPF